MSIAKNETSEQTRSLARSLARVADTIAEGEKEIEEGSKGRGMARAVAMDKRERQSCAISKRPITRERNVRAKEGKEEKKRDGTRK